MNNTEKPRRGRERNTAVGRGKPRQGKAPARPETDRSISATPGGRPFVLAAVRIEQVRAVLGEVLQWEFPADAVLSRWLKAHPKLGMRDRGEVAEAVFDVLRNL